MSSMPHVTRDNPMGQYQRHFAIFIMLFIYQLPLISSVFLLVYSLFTMNYYVWLIFICISIAQYPIGKSQKYIKFVNNFINPLLYFKKFERIFQQQIPENQPSLFSFHPHGVMAYGLLANMNYHRDALSRCIGLSSRFILNMPITGLLLRLWGIQSVDAKNLKRLMISKRNIGLLPGGFQQATLTSKKQLRLYIQNRKGFIKYALKYNYNIYPILILNEHRAFWTFQPWLKFRMFLNKIKIPAVLFFHPKTLLFYPPELEFITIIGKKLRGKKYEDNQQPTSQEIDQMHQKYIEQIQRIYKKYQHKNDNVPMIIY